MKRWLVIINLIVIFLIICFNINFTCLQSERLMARVKFARLNVLFVSTLERDESLLLCFVVKYWENRKYLSKEEQNDNIRFLKMIKLYRDNYFDISTTNSFWYQDADKIFRELD
ncbi:MAG: hypothetical protein PF692_08635 [Kiritimatiellae bacterium]|nr:hypothetical protein [Kiritimatiellia bacterium]